jgi:dTDP-4-dehydrorhamnose reductase
MTTQSGSAQTKIPLLTTGLNGLVGSKFAQIFQDKYQFDSLDLRHPTHPVDITDQTAVDQAIQESEAETLIHLAAFTNVNAAWEQRGDKNGLVYQVNVNGTQNIIEACKKYDKHLIHISTAYVFDGNKETMYTEQDEPNPIEWYGQTKWEAEQLVMGSSLDWTILRIDQPFRSDPFEKTDIAHKIANKLQAGELYPMFDNHFVGPTYIDDFAKVLDYFVLNKETGLFHATSGEKWSDYQLAQTINQKHDLDGSVERGDLDDYLKKLNRPYQRNTALDSSKLTSRLEFELQSVEEALAQLEINKNKSLSSYLKLKCKVNEE